MKVLVAEDDRVSRRVLGRYLTKWGYEGVCVEDGTEAWKLFTEQGDFHLAILDWNMPGYNGIQLCRKIRRNAKYQHVYIILLTGRSEKKDLVVGFEAGADDYVVKPFDPVELASRLKVGCRLVESSLLLFEKNKELNRYADEMETLAEERAKMLVHSDRLASLGTLTAGIAHEINNPTTFISGNAQTLERVSPIIETALRNDLANHPENAKKIEMVLEEVPKMITGIRNGVSRVSSIVKGLKSFARQDKNTKETLDINECLDQGLLICNNKLKQQLVVKKEYTPDLGRVMGDPQKLEQVFINLFVNAADAHEEQGLGKPGMLYLRTRGFEGYLEVEVEDDGPGIPKERIRDIWKPFFTTKEGTGTGLGLAISQGIVADHMGEIIVENIEDGGARFTIRLPTEEGVEA